MSQRPWATVILIMGVVLAADYFYPGHSLISIGALFVAAGAFANAAWHSDRINHIDDVLEAAGLIPDEIKQFEHDLLESEVNPPKNS